MARAPLSAEERASKAMFVFVGRVRDVADAGEVHVAEIEIETVEEELMPVLEDVETVRYRRPAAGDGSKGDAGQHSPLTPGERVRVWVATGPDDELYLLEPNGWESAG